MTVFSSRGIMGKIRGALLGVQVLVENRLKLMWIYKIIDSLILLSASPKLFYQMEHINYNEREPLTLLASNENSFVRSRQDFPPFSPSDEINSLWLVTRISSFQPISLGAAIYLTKGEKGICCHSNEWLCSDHLWILQHNERHRLAFQMINLFPCEPT